MAQPLTWWTFCFFLFFFCLVVEDRVEESQPGGEGSSLFEVREGALSEEVGPEGHGPGVSFREKLKGNN